MTMARFFARIGKSAVRDDLPSLGYRSYEAGALSLTVAQGPVLDLREAGAIVGPLFDRTTMRRVTTLGTEERHRLVDEGVHGLVTRYWGAYVAFLAAPDQSTRVLRAPLGELPCLYMETNDGLLVASDLDMAELGGLPRPTIAWDRICHELATRDLRWPQTCLTDLSDLAGGQCLEFVDSQTRVTDIWSPWAFVGKDRRIAERDEAAALVGVVARASICARASDLGKVILMLSGGLDSSIVAACLAACGTDFTALNLVTKDAIGDERHHARRVANWLNVPLCEPLREVDRIDVTRSGARRLSRPGPRVFLQESTRLVMEAATGAGATAIFTGGGGDNVFCSLQSASPVADRLLTSGLGPAFWRTAVEVSRLAPASLTSVITDAVRRVWLGKPPLTSFRDFSLMTPQACRDIVGDETHPWLQVPRDVLPGSAAFVRLIAFARIYLEGFDPQALIPTVAPLLSQPLVETCLRVPTWLWLEDGRNRVVARHAFADALPPDILARRSKGTPDSFIAEIYEKHRAKIREFLADGSLVQEKVIDRPAMLAILDRPPPARGTDYTRILRLVDVEAWIQARL